MLGRLQNRVCMPACLVYNDEGGRLGLIISGSDRYTMGRKRVMQITQLEKARRFHDLHTADGCFLMANAWDAGSAKMLAAAGFAALATTSAGVAFSLGHPDHGFCSADARVDRDTMLVRIESMASG